MLTVSNLRKSYKNFSLKDVSFSVKKGRITGFIGNNGSGKTTTIKCILDLVAYEAGQILIDGKTICQNEREYKEKIGVIFDEGYFYDNLSIRSMKNVIAAAYENWDEPKYQDYMKRFKLSESQRIETLSKGMKMKFALALALSHAAELLILDEPSGGLDPKTRQLFCNELLEQKRNGKTVLFSTHITSDLDKIGDDIILINQGTIIKASTKERFLSDSNLQSPTIEAAMLEIIERGEL